LPLRENISHVRRVIIMKATVDIDLCIGCGLCEATCPEVFKLDEDEGHSMVIVETIPASAEACAEEARDTCPVDAITID